MATVKKMSNWPLIEWLTNNPLAGWFWLVVRVWLGWQWISASLHKLGSPDWMQTGNALKGFWAAAAAVPDGGKPAITFDWYRAFIQFMLDAQAYTWFAKLVAIGEFTVGLCLILGLFTGIAAFIGGFMNWNFMMAGSASTNPFLFVCALGLVMAWKVAGHYGLDRWVLPKVGVPWDWGKS